MTNLALPAPRPVRPLILRPLFPAPGPLSPYADALRLARTRQQAQHALSDGGVICDDRR